MAAMPARANKQSLNLFCQVRARLSAGSQARVRHRRTMRANSSRIKPSPLERLRSLQQFLILTRIGSSFPRTCRRRQTGRGEISISSNAPPVAPPQFNPDPGASLKQPAQTSPPLFRNDAVPPPKFTPARRPARTSIAAFGRAWWAKSVRRRRRRRGVSVWSRYGTVRNCHVRTHDTI